MENKVIVQSYQLTTARQNYNLISQRAMLHIVKSAQYTIEGQHLNTQLFDKIETDQWQNKHITIPIAELDPAGATTNYTYIKEQLKELFNITAEWKYKGGVVMRPFVQEIKIDEAGVASFEIDKKVWELILDYSKGYRKFELKSAMQCKSPYSLRFYELITEKDSPITYKIDYLKKMFKLEKKYPNNYDFLRRIVEPSKKELDKIAPYTFRYEKIYDDEHNGKGRKPIKSIMLIPIHQPEKEDKALASDDTLKRYTGLVLDKDIQRILVQNYGFSTTEIKNNLELILKAQREIDLLDLLVRTKKRAGQTSNPKGYLINAIKYELQSD